MKTTFKNILLGISIVSLNIACVPDRVDGDGNGIVPSTNDASFTVTKTSENHYMLTSSNNNYLFSKWNLDNGGGFNRGPNTFEAFFPDAGTYVVKHQIWGQGGVVAGTSEQTINVLTTDPNSGNLVEGGKFNNAADWAKWTINNTGAGANWNFTTGWATLTAQGWAGQGIYQAIPVKAGKKYKIDMVAKSTSGCNDTWFEVYVGYNAPVQGQDYNGDGTKYRFISTWDGQGTTSFEGLISAVGGSNKDGIFTATQDGTVYLGIRGGGADMKDGIAITNVEFRGTN